MFFHSVGSLLRSNFFELVLNLKDFFVENWLVDISQKCLVADHSLGEFIVRDSTIVEITVDIRYQNKWGISYFIISVSLGQKNFDNCLDWWQRGQCGLQPLKHVTDRSEDL